jgi:UDP-N-acetylmuramoyl-tripeptide--D-alanyl-D-alanine ligase
MTPDTAKALFFSRQKFPSLPSSNTIWTSTEISRALGIPVSGSWSVTGISVDCRAVCPGDLYVAVSGADDVEEAFENGAVATIVSHLVPDVEEDRQIVVSDPDLALELLAAAARMRSAAHIIVAQGNASIMLNRVFSALGQTHSDTASAASLARMHAGCDYGVFDLGLENTASASCLVRPHVAIVAAAGASEIFAGMDMHGIAILNRDDPEFEETVSKAKRSGIKKIFGFGESESADARLVECLVASNGTRVRAEILGEEVSFAVKGSGKITALESLAVLLAVKLLGADMGKALAALESVEREYLNIGDPNNPVTLIDESCNASPATMQAAFKVLALVDPGRGGRRIAILGDMLELGSEGPRAHAELALPLKAANVDLVYTCGTLMKNLHDRIPNDNRGAHADSGIELAQIVPDVLVPGDVVMVKGSAGGDMDVVVEALRALPGKKRKANQEG